MRESAGMKPKPNSAKEKSGADLRRRRQIHGYSFFEEYEMGRMGQASQAIQKLVLKLERNAQARSGSSAKITRDKAHILHLRTGKGTYP